MVRIIMRTWTVLEGRLGRIGTERIQGGICKRTRSGRIRQIPKIRIVMGIRTGPEGGNSDEWKQRGHERNL